SPAPSGNSSCVSAADAAPRARCCDDTRSTWRRPARPAPCFDASMHPIQAVAGWSGDDYPEDMDGEAMRTEAEDTEVTGNRSTSTRTQTQQAENGNGTRAGNIPALERATGRSWEQWLEIFTAQNAKEQDHATIARIARAEMPDDLHNPDWWAQGAAI